MDSWENLICGYHKKVPTAHGFKRYINLDNAASTPPFKAALAEVVQESDWYASVHRGNGYKSIHTTEKYELARKTIATFIGADLNRQSIIFTKNTTDAINKVSHYLTQLPGRFVIYTRMEHHSNELPWPRESFCLDLKDGRLDLEQLQEILKRYCGQIKLVAVTGASNVTGYIPPIHTIAAMAHRAGAKILVDGAQLIPHRPVNLFPTQDPRHLDFFAFSGHKMYAPYGAGILVGPQGIFGNIPPSQVGGGTVKGASNSGIVWMDPPELEEAGSPNVLGALALAKAAEILPQLGWSQLIAHEQNLILAAQAKLREFPEVMLYCCQNPEERVGVICFNVQGFYHEEVAGFLAQQYGIGVRSGCFCARNHVHYLLQMKGEGWLSQQFAADVPQKPGMVRISFGLYNQLADVEILGQAIHDFLKKNRRLAT